MLIGFTITVLTFEHDVAVLALLFLSIGDSFAGIFGRIFHPYSSNWGVALGFVPICFSMKSRSRCVLPGFLDTG